MDNIKSKTFTNAAMQILNRYSKVAASDVWGLDFSGFGQARAFMHRASGGPGFLVSGFGLYSGFCKV